MSGAARPPPPPPPPETVEGEEEEEEVVEEDMEEHPAELTWGAGPAAPSAAAAAASARNKGPAGWEQAAGKLLSEFEKLPRASDYIHEERQWDANGMYFLCRRKALKGHEN